MKRYLPFFVLLFAATRLFAQITVTNATFPVAGDVLNLAIDNSPTGIVPFTPPGGNQVWDFTSLLVDATQNITYNPASAGSQGANVPGAELFAVLSTGTENYYNVTNTKFELQAYWGILPYDLVTNNLFEYSPTLPERRAPLNFFDINASSSGFLELFLPSAFPPLLMINLAAVTNNAQIDSMRYRVAISGIDVVDGWGTVNIPGGTYDVLREKRTKYTETRIDAKIPPLGWLDITDNCIQAGFNGLGVDTMVAFYFHNNVAKEHIAIATLNNQQNAVTKMVFKANGPSCPTGNVLFVKANATGTNNGTSWANAFTSLQSALASTCPGITEIWVAAGTYTPTTTADRNISFVMKNGVAIYGGFAGTETMRSQRNWSTNVTTLSGDIGAAGNADNSFNVVKGSGTNSTAILDGFTITEGNANAASAPGNYYSAARNGGGMYNSGGSPAIRNCFFKTNSATSFGGGMFNFSSSNTSPTVTNCAFTSNTAANGGGICNSNFRSSSVPVIANCSFYGNTAGLGGGILVDSSRTQVINCIIWGNSSGLAIDPSDAVNITNSIIQGGCPPFGATCTSVLNVDPLYVDAPGGNLRLQACSPAINAGTATGAPATDYDNDARPFGAGFDIGYDEYTGGPCCTFAVPANGSGTVACPALATPPTPPVVTNSCGNEVVPTGPVITNDPSPLTCEGTRTYTWTYTYNTVSLTWAFTYTIEREDFTIILPNGSATVACPALATQPVPPMVGDNCSQLLSPSGPVITFVPNTLTCEGTKTYTWTYTDCEGNSHQWSFVYTIERDDFAVPANGDATVACPALATPPTPPTVLSNCGETIAPTGPVASATPACEGTKTYTWTYTDCEGNSHDWAFIYTIERNDFAVPANGDATVACPALVTPPTPPTVLSNCGETIAPTGPVASATPACEGTKTYTWTYTDCEGNSHDWVFTYTIERNDFAVPANGSATVACPALATPQTPPTVLSNCGETIAPTAPTITNNPNPVLCVGTRTYTYTYTDCEGNSHPWSFVYNIVPVPFSVPPSGSAMVACPALATQPTPPVVLDNCGNPTTPTGPVIVNNPNPITCEGTRTYTWTYTDCAGNTTPWSFVYTIERLPFTVPANGTATVACPALAVTPTLPTVTSNCGEVLLPSSSAIVNNPNPLTCEGTRTYAYTYTDCEGNTATWSFIYTIERLPFTVPANGAATVACPAHAGTQPTPPVVTSNCGEVLTPTGPVITNNPNPLTCEGTRSYTWTYTDCEGNTASWSFVYTIERLPFTVPANGSATVACPDQSDVQPTPPVVTSNCGEVLTPVITSSPKLGCEGNRNWYFTYTDCEGNTATWIFFYTVEYGDFVVPPSVVKNVECPSNIQQPMPPTVFDSCGKLLNPTGPVITGTQNAQGCEASRSYTWTYKDCEGNTHTWGVTYNFLYEADFFAPQDEVNVVGCLSHAVPPVPQTLYDICDQVISVSGPDIIEIPGGTPCSGTLIYTFVYTDCGGHSHPWTFTVHANDDEPPIGECPSGTEDNVDVTDLDCVEDVPCPDDFDFSDKIKEMLEAGGIYDLCSGTDLVVKLDSWSELWECSDPDGDGQFSFGRTVYFSIADPCGNEMPELCSVTYSGDCQPISAFPQEAWGLNDENSQISLADIQHLLDNYGPLTIGGENSLTLTQASCVASLLPAQGGPGPLGDCDQVDCTGGCNPTSPGGIKNDLAANAIAMMLNLYYSMDANGANMQDMMELGLGCLNLDAGLVTCVGGGIGTGGIGGQECSLHVFDQNGMEHTFPYTLGGLMELLNAYLGGDIGLDDAESGVYGTALNAALNALLGQYGGAELPSACDPDAGAQGSDVETDKALPTGSTNTTGKSGLILAPNPANREVSLRLAKMAEAQEVSLEIYNAYGQLMLRKAFGRVAQLDERIELNGFNNGLYFVKVQAGGQRFEQKLVIGKE